MIERPSAGSTRGFLVGQASVALVALTTFLATPGAIGSAWAGPPYRLPPVQQRAGVEFMTGGLGGTEGAAMEDEASRWPVVIQFHRTGEQPSTFVHSVHLRFRDGSGALRLDAFSGGPYFLAKLPPGDYQVEAAMGGLPQRRSIRIAESGTTRLTFVWPAIRGAASSS